MTTSRLPPAAGFLVGCVLLAAGCGDAGPKLYRVSGTVTFNGKPVPMGNVYFDPDPGKGGRGRAGSASIKDGKFDTALDGGQGIEGGHYDVRVLGFDGKVGTGSEAPLGGGLFPEYVFKKELPAADSTLDVDVPKKK